jgi:hypothetical protein
MSAFPRLISSVLLISLSSHVVLKATGAEPPSPTRITLYPQGESQPALKYRLLPDFPDRIDGNAVVYLGMVKSEQNAFFGNRELRDNIDGWQRAPLEELREVENLLSADGGDSGVLYYLDQAARCDHADWQLPIGREPFFEMLLPAVQESRQFARILAAHSRLQLAHGNFDRAIKGLRNSFGVGRHVARNETLVGGLVGIAICGNAVPQIETLSQVPNAPNLYWALSNLPVPLVDLRAAVDAEMHGVELSFPEVRDLEAVHLTPQQWRERLLSLLTKVHAIADEKDWQPTAEYLDKAIPRILPQAKQSLIERDAAPKAIEKMADEQIILMDVVKRNMETRQEAAKWFPLPYPIASKGLLAVHERTKQQWKEGRDIAPLPQLSAGPLYVCRRAQVRLDRQIAALRVLEALRIYAAAYDGRLPDQLADVTEVPIPNDPVSEKPFEYRLTGTTAVLTGPALTDAPLMYEITMAKSQ